MFELSKLDSASVNVPAKLTGNLGNGADANFILGLVIT